MDRTKRPANSTLSGRRNGLADSIASRLSFSFFAFQRHRPQFLDRRQHLVPVLAADSRLNAERIADMEADRSALDRLPFIAFLRCRTSWVGARLVVPLPVPDADPFPRCFRFVRHDA